MLRKSLKNVNMNLNKEAVKLGDRPSTININKTVVKDIKEKNCFIKVRSESSKSYEMPDGSKIILGKELYESTEILFNPKIISKLFNKTVNKKEFIIKLKTQLINLIFLLNYL